MEEGKKPKTGLSRTENPEAGSDSAARLQKKNTPGAMTNPSRAAESPAERIHEVNEHVMAEQDTVVFSSVFSVKKDKESTDQPTLEVISGSASKNKIILGEEKLTIGRIAFNDLMLNDKKVSRSHAALYFEKGHYVVEDLNSTNGVYVDDHQVKKIVLRSGNRITVGDTVLLFTQGIPEISLENQIDFINRSELFNWLDEETKGLLARSLVLRFFPKNTTVFMQNTPIESMFFLYSGSARMVELNEEGGEKIVDQINAGESFGESALLAGESCNYSVVSSTDIHVLELKTEQLNELLQKKPELFKAFYRMVLKKFTSAQAKPQEGEGRLNNLRHLIVPTDVEIIGEDQKIKEAKKKIEALAKEEKTVLLTGLSGTGKKYFARYFHKVSPHPEYPYVEISVAELDAERVGSSIFGVEADLEASHMKGQMGYLEMIGTGTLVIAHAEQLDAHQQSKLSTYLKYGWFHRVYGRESVKAKTRVVLVATGSVAEVQDKLIPELGELLKDQIIHVPSLLQRLKDIPILADYYLKLFARKNGKRISGLSREATERLVSYSWPGNVKELENVIQRAAIVASEDVIIPGDLIFVVPSEKERHKLNVLRNERIRDILRHPLIPQVFIWFNMVMVVIMAGFTLFGGSRPEGHPLQDFGNNPGMLITWLIWFPILPISAFLIGRIWCGICPIAGFGDLAARVKSFNLPVPKFLKRMDFWMVVISFLLLDYLEEFLGVSEKPLATGMLLVFIIGLSVIFCVLFERKTFCRYVCPLAGMLGAYSTLSLVEIRGNKKICQTQCGQHLCYKGTEHAPGCPMFSYPASLSTNSECMMCISCLKSCENRGVQLNLRPPLQELWHQSQPLLSLSLFGVMLVGLMGRHQFPALTYWKTLQGSLAWSEGLTSSVLYLLFVTIAVVPFFLSSLLSAAASQEKVSENMAHYGIAFIPLALSGHLSHVAHEFLSSGVYELLAYFIKLYDLLIGGVPIGSREVVMLHFIHGSVITFIKFMLITGGMLGTLIALFMIARRVSDRNVLGRIMPHLLLLLFFWSGYLFIFTGSTGAATLEGSAPSVASQEIAGRSPPLPANPQAQLAAPAQAQQRQPGPVALSITFSLTIPNIKSINSVRMDAASVAKWLQSAKQIPTTRQYQLTLQGQVAGAPAGAQVRASLDLGALKHQFSSNLDANGNFSGAIILDSMTQRVPLVLQLVDARTNSILHVHKVTLY